MQKATRFYDDFGRVPVYQTNSKHRGAVLIINNRAFINNIQDLREGSEVDVINLKNLYKQMYMLVDVHTDKTKEVCIFKCSCFLLTIIGYGFNFLDGLVPWINVCQF